MTTRNLEYLFAPESVAVIGASDRSGSVGAAVTRNLLAGGFQGTLRLVNPQHDRVAGQHCYRGVRDLDLSPQLAVICTPPATVPGLIAELGAKGTKAAIVLTAGLARYQRSDRPALSRRPCWTRPSRTCCAFSAPTASDCSRRRSGSMPALRTQPPTPAHLAFVSQSGALTTALLDWARARDRLLALRLARRIRRRRLRRRARLSGDAIRRRTRSCCTSKSIKHARKFMSAARAAARNKPIIVVKAGRAPEGAKAAASHTGALAGSDDVYDAALRRAGMLRVDTTTRSVRRGGNACAAPAPSAASASRS